MKVDIGGCKLAIKEKTSKSEILNAMALFLTQLEEHYGIEEFSNINVYMQMYKDGEKQVLVDKSNLFYTYDSFDFTLKNVPAYKTIVALADGSKKISFNKEIDYERIQKSVEATRNNSNPNPTTVAIPTSMYKAKMTEIINKKKEEEEIAYQKEVQAYEARLKKEEDQRQLLESFKEMIAKKLNTDIKNLPTYTSSIAYLKDERTMLKYISKEQIPTNMMALRVTYRNPKTREITHSEIYNLDLVLIK